MMGQQKPPPFMAGDQLNADEMTDIATSGWAGQQSSIGGPGEIIRPPGTPTTGGTNNQPYIFARITGKGSGCDTPPSGAIYAVQPPDNNYCGIQIVSDTSGNIEDAPAGLVFESWSFPLVEMTGNPAVPIDAVVMAIPSADLDHYEFVWTGGEVVPGSGDGCGSGCTVGVDPQCFVQCVNNQLFVRPGCLYVIINGQRVYVQFEPL